MNRPIALLSAALVLLMAVHLVVPLAPLLELRRTDPGLATLLLTEIRLPRTLLAAGYGAVLGMTGAALQATFANPLASPDITGSSSGAALGAVLGGYWLGISDPLALAAFGAGGAGLALGALLLLAGRRSDSAALLLAGVAIALAAGAATSLLLALAPSPFAFYDSFEWLMGSFVDRSLPQAAAALIPAGLACALLARRARALDLMALGEDVAASLGFPPRRVALEVVALSAVAVGACVSVCGAIGFVGLIAPYAARRISGGHPGRALLPAAPIGAMLLVVADLAVRFAPAGRVIPVGILTTIVGTPLLIWLVMGMRRTMTRRSTP
ncbi:MAG: iron ABC transporter permease [Sphingomicrobium sp.]